MLALLQTYATLEFHVLDYAKWIS